MSTPFHVSRWINSRFLIIAVSLLLLSVAGYATPTINPFADLKFCATSYPTAYQSVGTFSLDEGANADFNSVQTNKTIILTLPAGFEFNTAVGTVSFTAGRNITALSAVTTTTTITITVSVSGTNRTDHITFSNFQVRATAAGGGDLVRTGGTFTINGSTTVPSSTQSFGRLDAASQMSYISSSVVQYSTADIYSNCSSSTNPILEIQVNVSGSSLCPSTITQFNFNTAGDVGYSQNPATNITNARLYYSGQTQGFNSGLFFGFVSAPNGAFTITGSQTLSLGAGTYYFYLTYDVPATANVGDRLDASMTSFVIDGNTKTDMSTPNPGGTRSISTGTCPATPDVPNPPANIESIPKGSLVIPMDNAHQSLWLTYPFNIKAYGLVNSLLQNDIPVKWVITSGKAKDAVDFSATAARIYPTTATAPAASQNFKASAFIIDSQWLNKSFYQGGQTATQVISAFANQWKVAVYQLSNDISVDVRYTLSQRPKIAIFSNGTHDQIHQKMLDSAKISNYVVINAGDFTGLADCYTFCSEAHWDYASNPDTVPVQRVWQFVHDGGNFLVQCAGMNLYENHQRPNRFMTTNGIDMYNTTITNSYYNPDMAFNQYEGSVVARSGTGAIFERSAGSSYIPGAYFGISTSISTDTAVAAGIKLSAPTAIGSNVFYLGGHDYMSSLISDADVNQVATLNYINGVRMYLNAALIPSNRPTAFGLTPGSDRTICQGDVTTLGGSPTGPVGATYSWTPALGLDDPTLSNPNASPTTTTAYSVVAVHGNCTGGPATVTVTVIPSPTITSAAAGTICSGVAQNYTITSSVGGTSFNWSRAAVAGISNATVSGQTSSTITETLINTTTSPISVTYVIVPTVGSCPPGTPFNYVVTVNPTPSVTSAATASICNSTAQNYTITSNVAGTTYTWSRSAVAGISNGAVSGQTSNPITESLTNTTGAPVNVVYQITPSANGCTGSVFTYTVTVYPTPVVTTASTASTCSGTGPNISLTANVASTFTWTIGTITGGITGASAGSGSTINQTLTNPGNATAGTVQYIVTPTSTTGSCGGTPYTITVTVNPTPAVTTAATKSICNATNPSIGLTASAPSTFTWTIGTITGGITGASAGSGSTINQTLTNPSNATAGTVQYIVTPTSTTGSCAGSPYTITVTVNPTPAVTTAATASTCTGTGPNIALTASAPSTFTWTIGTITGGITGASAGSGSTINQTLTNPSNATAGTVQYIVTPTSTTGSCVGSPYTITVTVNPTPAVTTAATASTCNGTGPNISLAASAPSTFTWTIGTITGGITGASAGSGSTINQTLTNPSNATAGTVQYIVTPTSTTGSCVGSPYTITVTVNPTPAVTTAATKSICNATNPSIGLTASAPSTFTWTIGTITGGITGASAGSGSTINQTLTNPSNATAGTVQYIVTPTSTTGSCVGSPYTITVTVNPTPAVTTAATASTCNGTSPNIALTASAPSTFTWTIGTITGGITGASAGSGSTINQTLTNPSNATAGTVQYIVTPTSTTGSCVGSPYTITVTVNPTPAVTTAATASTCNGTGPSISLTASAPSTFTWTIGTITGGITGASAGSGSTINQTLTNPSNATAGTVQYIVTPTSTTGSCVGSPYTITVTVNPTPAVTTAATASTCNGTGPNIALTASAPSTFTWTIGTITGSITGASAGSGSTINQTLTNPSNATAGTVQYIVTPTSTAGSCVGSPYTITVTVNPTPAVTTAATASTCNGTGPNIALTASAPSTFTWTIGTITGGITGASAGSGSTINQTLTNPSNATAGTVQYIVTPTSTTGSCAGSPYTITVTVNPTPAVTTASTKSTCNGTGPNIALTASAPSTFTWTIGTITGSITGASAGSGSTINQTLTNPSNATAGTVQYIVTPTSTTGSCVGSPYTITVTVNPTPAVTTAATASTCNGTGPNISLTASAPSTFTWTIGTITGGITGASAGSGSTINQTLTNPSNATAGTVQYIVTPTSTTGSCVGLPYTITVTVNPTPAVTTASTASTCNGTGPNIALTASAPSTFTWTIGTITGGITGASAGSGSTINQVLTNPSNATAGTVQYIVTPTSTTGSCVGSPYTITVTVNPTPAVTTAATASTCNGTSPNIALTASAPSTFTWTIGTITGSITGASAGSGNTINQTLTNPSNATAGTVQYIVTPTSTTGSCVGSPYTITVTVNPTPVVTTAATASTCNGTGPNIALTASAPSTFAWTIGTITGGITGASAGSGSTINQTLTNPSNATAGTVQYIVTPTSTTGSCAGSPYTITVTVNPTPAVTTASTKSTCNGTGPNIALTASAPSTFAWTIGTITGSITGASAGSGSTINQTLTNPSNATAGTVQYIVTPTSTTGSCVGSPYTITVTVNPTPAVTTAATASTCNGTGPNIALTASAPSTFTWTIGTITGGITGASAGSGSTINQTLTNPSNATAGTVQYIVTPTSTIGSCVGSPYTITVTVNPTPAVTTAATASTCNGTGPNIALTASAPSTFTWTIGTITGSITGASAGSGSTINQVLTNPSNATAGTVQYIVTPTSTTGSCAGAPYTITVTVNPTPAVTTASTASTCNGTGPNIALTASAPSTFTWTIGTITGGITGASAGSGNTINQVLTNPSNATAGTVQYIVTPTSTTGSCVGSPYTITVTVNPTPAITTAATASTCNGTGPNIALTASAPSTFTWTIGTITGSITGASAGSGSTINQVLTNPGNATAGTVQYIVTPTSTTGSCVGSPYTITVTVNPTPAVTTAATASTCNGTGPNIALTASAPSTFTWTIGTITGGITGASAGSGSTINQTLTNPSNATAGTVQYIVTPTSTTGSCAGSPYTITVTVNPTPAVTTAATASTCNGTGPNISLTASAPSTFTWTIGTITGGITGASAGSGSTINQVLTNPSNATAGTVQYIVTPTSTTGSCVGSPYTITVTVNPTPAVTTAATASTCNGTSPNIALTASAPSTFTWTIGTITGGITGASAGSGSTINQTLTNPSNATAGTVQYIVTPTSTTGSCAGSPYTITVTVNPTPVVTTAATASTCNGTGPNIALTASAPSTFAWTIGTITGGITGAIAGSGSTINQTLTNPSNATAGTVQYIVTPTSTTGSCAGSPYTITVTVNPTPVVTNPATASTCNGTGPNISLTASAPSTFTWTIGTITGGITGASAGSGSTINQVLTNPSNATAGTVQYIVTPTSTTGSCVGSPYTITVTVNPTPAVTTAATKSICNATNPSIGLTASAPSTFTWTIGTITGGITGASAGSGSTINQTLTNPSNATAGTVQYIITPTSTTGSCVGSPYTITVTVNPTPAVTTASTNSTCNGTGPNISLTASAPSTFTWTIGTITGSITGASAGSGSTINQTLTNPSNTTAGTVQYIVTPTSTTGSCAGAPYTITVTVNPTPAVTTAATASTCNGTGPNIALTASAPSTFAWTIGTITGGITGASAGSGNTISQVLTNPSNATAGTVQYIVTPTSTTGSCVGSPYTITVTVNPTPAVTTASTASTCNGTGPNISLTASAPSTFTWTIGTITGGITGASAGSGSTINQTLTNPSNATAGTVQYIVTPTSTTGSCVGSPYTITVTVNPTPAVTTAATASTCNGTSPNIALTASAPSTFTWTIGTITGGITGASAGSGSTINQVLTNPSNATAGTVQYIVTPTSTTGSCVGSPYTITVTVNPTPAVTTAATASTCNGTGPNISLTASAPSTFTWTIGTITGGITGASAGSGSTINQTLTNPSNATAGTVQYIVTPTSTTGSCVGSSYTITVTVNPTPAVTTAATASTCNGTGPNIALTASAPSTFTWTIGTITGSITGASAGSGSTINQTLTNPSNSSAGTVEYLVTPASSTGSCGGSPYTITVTVNPTPAVTTAATASTCNGTGPNIALTASAPSTFTWTIGTITGSITGASAGLGSTINQTLTNPSNATAGTVQYIVTPTSVTGSCVGSPYTITVTVNPTPAVTTAATASTCNGTGPNIALTASAPSTFTWTIGTITGSITGASAGSGSTINQTLTNPSNATAGTVQYIVTPTSTTGSCVGSPYTITVTVNPTPAVTTAATASTCNGTGPNIALTASAPSTFAWTIGTITGGITGASAGSGSTINQTLTNPSNSSAGTVEYLVTPASSTGSCGGSPYTITVTVNPTPAVTTAATASTCNGTGPNIALTASAPSTFTWTIGTITGSITGASAGSGNTINQTLTNPGNATAGTVQYIVTPTSTTGSCAGAPYTITVTVNPTPAVTTSSATSICNNTSPNISLTASAPSTFTWTIGTITGSITGASAGSGSTINQVLINPSNATAGTVQYIVTPTSTTGSCVGSPYTITVTVNPTPAVTTSSTASTCNGTGPNIALTASAPSTFTWTIGTITGSITGASAGSGSTINQVLANPSNSSAGTVEYLVTPASSTGSCGGSPYTITVTVNPTPAVTTASTASTCNGTGPNIALTASAPSTFTWTIGTITGGITGASAGSGSTINQVLTNPSNATAGTVQYIVTPTSVTGSCVGAPYTITITVNPTPAVTTSSATSICNNTSPNISLTASAPSTFTWTIGTITGSITGASAGSGSTINQTLTNPSNATAGTVQYIVTPTSTTGSCVGSPYTITVTVNPTPAVTTAATASTCNGTGPNISLTASAPSTFTWTIGTITGGITGASAGSGSTINQTLTNPGNSTAGTVEYIVTPTSVTGSCVGSPYTITVTVNPTPAVTTSSATSICNNTSPNISLTASAPGTFTWTIGTITGGITGASAGSGSTINQTLTNPSNATAGTVQYIVTPTSVTGSCVGAPYTITVTVNPTPAITTASTASTCSGTGPNIALAASAPSTFTWTIGTITGSITGASAGSGSTINQTLTNPGNATAGTVEYIVTPTSVTGNCVGAPYTITITVNPTPVVTAAPNATICSGATTNISLAATNTSTFTWTIGTITGGITGASAGSGNTISQTLTNPSNSSAGSIEYIVTPASVTGACPGVPYTITVTVNPIPTMSTPPAASICNGANTNIALTASTPSTFSWTLGTITGGITGASAGTGNVISQVLTNPSSTSSGTVEYLVTPTSSMGCVGSAFSIIATVTVNPTPAVTTAPTASICNATGPNIALTASAPSTFAWTIGTITGNITGASAGSGSTINQTLTNPGNATSGTVEYIVVPTSVAGSCPGAPYPITVTVNPTPAVTTASTASICNATSPNIALTASAPSTFTWTIGTITGGITGAGAGSGNTINQTLTNPGNATAGTVEYIVTPTSVTGSCVGSPYTITVTVDPTPVVTNAATTSICNSASTNISLTASTPSTFTWTIGTVTGGITGASAGSGSTINQTLTNPGNATAGTVQYIVTPTSVTGNCVGSPYTITVTVNPTPAVTTASNATICSGTSTNISLTATNTSTYTWTVGTITGSITGANGGSGSTISQVLTNPGNATAGTVDYIVTPTSAAGGCGGSPYTITVTVNPIPSMVTPPATSICNGGNTNISLVASTPSTFSWTLGTITGGITGATSGSGNTISQTLVNPSSVSSGTVEYIVTPTAVTGCIGSAFTITATVTVNPTPSVTTAPAAAICDATATNIALTATTASTFIWTVGPVTGGITGAAAGNGNTISQTLNNPGNTTPGTVQYIVVPTSVTGSCPGAPYPITVTVNPTPVVTTAPTASICNATTTNIVLTASAPSTFSWTVGAITGSVTGASAGSGSTISQTLINPGNTTAGTVEYIVTPSSVTGNCPGAPYTITVTVYPTATITSAATGTICNNTAQNYTITSSVAGTTYSWTRNTVAGISNASVTGQTSNPITETLINTTNAPVDVTYVITPSANGCANPVPFNYVVTVYPTATVTSAGTGTICNNTAQNYTITSSVTGTTYSWTRNTVAGISNAAANNQTSNPITETLVNTTNAPVDVTYVITPSANGCANPVPFNYVVTVYPTATVTSAGTGTICNNTAQNYTITSSVAGTTYSWTRNTVAGISNAAANNQTSNPITETLVNTTNAPVDVTYVITPSANGCANPVPFNYVVTVYPTATVTSAATGTICNNTAQNYTITSSVAGTTYSWTRNTVAGISNPSVTGQTSNPITETLINTTNAPVDVTYVITPSANGCANPIPFNYVVTVYPTATVTSAATGTICNNTAQNNTITSSVAGTTYSWTRNTVAGISNASVTGQTSNPITETLVNTTNAPVDVTYVITPSANGCANPVPFNYVVTVYPTATVTSAGTGTICNNTAQNYTITSSVAGTTYSWTRNTVAGISNPSVTGQTSNPITETLVNTTNAPVDVTYVITPSANGCANPVPFNYVVTVYPTATVTSAGTGTICNNTAQNYTITSSVAGTTYSWTRNTVAGISNASVTGQTSNPITETLINTTNAPVDVTYVITPSANGCANPVPFNYVVTVYPTATVTSAATGTICNNTAQNYTITSSVAGTTYSWTRNTVAGISNASVTGQASNPITETLVNTTNAPVDVTYVITPSANGCANPVPFNYVVTVYPTATVTSAGTGTICNNTAQNYTITSSVAGTTYSWTRNTVAGISNPSVTGQTSNPITETLVNTTNAPVDVTYVITPSANGCANPVPFNYVVTVYPTATVTSAGTGTICNNTAQNYTITSSVAGTTYSWTRNTVAGISNASVTGQTSNPITETLINTTNAPVDVTYVITPSANGCANPVLFNYVVTVYPTATVTSADSGTICNNTAQNYTITSSVAGTTYSWTRNTVAGISNASVTGQTSNPITETLINTTNAPVDVTYVITPSANGCANPVPFNYVVTVYPTATVTSAATGTICNNTAQNYTITSSVAGTTYSWTRNTVAGISNASVTGQTSNPITETLVNTTNASIDVTYVITPSANGCTTPVPFNYVITVHPTPTITSAATGIICSGGSTNYTITSSVAGTTYAWGRGAVTGISNPGVSAQTVNPINESLVNTTNVPIDVTYVITPIANGCAGPSFNYVVTVDPTPTVNSAATGIICSSVAQNYTITSPVAGATFTWSRSAVAGISNAPVSGQTANPITETLINTSNVPVSVSYVIIPSANGCATGPAFNYTVTVNPTPSVTSSGSGVICNNTAQNYTITSAVAGTTYTWTRNVVAGISNAAVSGQASNPITETLVNTTNAPVNVTYNIIPSANGCANPVPFDYVVTVNPTPGITSADSGIVCSGIAQNYTLTGSVAGTTYSWTRTSVAGISNATATGNANPITESLVNTTNAPIDVTYVITPSANGCANPVPFSYVVTVNPTPLVNSAAAATICSGTAQNYSITSAVAGTTFTWDRNIVAGISNAAVTGQTANPITETLINTTNGQVNVPYAITPIANGCTGPVFNYTVIVNPTPTMSSAATGSICSGVAQNYTITSGVAGTTYTWSRAAVTGISNSAVASQAANPITETLINTTNAPIDVTYVITLSANGCTNPSNATYVVTVNPRPIVTSSGSGIVCSGAPQNYTFTSPVPGTTFDWTRSVVAGISNPAASGNSNPLLTEALNNTTNAPIDVAYNVTPVVNGCYNPVPFVYTVTVNPTPQVNSAASGIICSDVTDSYTISGTVAGSSFTWTRATVPGISNSAAVNQASNPISESLTNTTTGTVNVDYVIIPSANGCNGPAFTYTKAVKPTPLTPVVTNNGPLCVGTTLNLTAASTPGASYSWTGPNGFSSTQQNPVRPGVSFADGGVYSVTATVNGCTSPVANNTVNVSSQPSTANAGSDQVICAGNNAFLLGTVTGGSTSGIWTTTGTGTFAPSNTSLLANYIPSNSDTAAGNIVITLTSTNNGACPASASSILVTITDAPTANAGADQTICAYKTVSLNGNISIATGGLWSSSGTGTFDPSPTTLNPTYIPSAADITRGNVTLTLTTTGTGGCLIANDPMKVIITPAPVVNAGPDRLVLAGNSVTLQPTVTGPVNTYSWSPDRWINSLTQPSPVVTPKNDVTYIVTVEGPGGCTWTDSVFIKVLFPPEIPNVFSPNGDGVNDKWNIKFLSTYPGCTVQVYTRYGQLIFNSVGYDEPWDGTFRGKPMPVGTYYYIIEPKNGLPRFSGYVVLLR